MKDYTEDLDKLYDSLATSRPNMPKYKSEPWLTDGYEIIDLDLDKEYVVDKGTGQILDSPEAVISFFLSGKREKVFYPNIGTDNPTNPVVNQQHSIFRSFTNKFVTTLTVQGQASYGSNTFFLMGDTICMWALSKPGRPKFWLTNVYHLCDSKDTIDQGLKDYILTIGKVYRDGLSDGFQTEWDYFPPRYISQGSLARKIYQAYMQDFRYDIKEEIPKEILLDFMNLKGNRFTTTGVGLTDSKEFSDYVTLYLQITPKLVPSTRNYGMWVKSIKYKPEALYAAIPIVGDLPRMGGIGVIPVKTRVDRKNSGLQTQPVQTRITFPVGRTTTPIMIGKPEYDTWVIEEGADLQIARPCWWFIPNRRTDRHLEYQATRWSRAVIDTYTKNRKYKFLYQFPKTGGTYSVYEEILTCEGDTIFNEIGKKAVAGTDWVQLSTIFSLARVLVAKQSLANEAYNSKADGSIIRLHGPESIMGYNLKYRPSKGKGFIFSSMRTDEKDTRYQDAVYTNRDDNSIPETIKTRIGIYGARTPFHIGRKLVSLNLVTPSGGDTRLPWIGKLGNLLGGFVRGEPLKTSELDNPTECILEELRSLDNG